MAETKYFAHQKQMVTFYYKTQIEDIANIASIIV